MSDFVVEMETHVKGLRRYARALTGGGADADDLVQETLRRILSYVTDGETIDNWRAYLFATLHNVWIDQLARTGLRNQVPLDDYLNVLATPASQLVRLEYLDLSKALANLPADQREVVLLVGMEGFSYRQVADALNIPVGTVMSRLSRGRATLRQSMEYAPEAGAQASVAPDAASSALEAGNS